MQADYQQDTDKILGELLQRSGWIGRYSRDGYSHDSGRQHSGRR
jgi:hypothetical protein